MTRLQQLKMQLGKAEKEYDRVYESIPLAVVEGYEPTANDVQRLIDLESKLNELDGLIHFEERLTKIEF
jgi:hypothetical protein